VEKITALSFDSERTSEPLGSPGKDHISGNLGKIQLSQCLNNHEIFKFAESWKCMIFCPYDSYYCCILQKRSVNLIHNESRQSAM